MPTSVPTPTTSDSVSRLALSVETARGATSQVITCGWNGGMCACAYAEDCGPALYGNMSYPPSTCFTDD